ncbi:MAG: DNA repair protein RecN [Betaproteobacteria bacterium]|nr:DNA repair protein RecN [Betaproteobacteria bacterium]
MLRTLAIRDYVIVESLELEAGAGFTVLTGETGAGKSILVDALELLVGGRADAGIVREGAERAELSAEFDVPARGALRDWLAANELEGDSGVLLLRRTIDRSGRSRCFVNGHSATLAQAREAGEWLLDIHGQHAHQSLLRAPAQRELLDDHAGIGAQVAECAASWRAWRRLDALAAEALAQFEQREAQRVELAERVADLTRLGASEGEWEAVSAEQLRLSHGSSLVAGAQSALEALDEAEGACLAQLGAVASRLRALSAHDAALQPIVEMLESAHAQAGEAARELRSYASKVDLDPAALHAAESRIEALHAAARRHRVKPAELHALTATLAARLAELDLAGNPEALAREVGAARTKYDALAAGVSAKRRGAAAALGKAVTAAMQKLAMAGGRFTIELRALETPAAHGAEDAEFLVSSHESLPLRPLAKVASGGELSRISLAIHLVAAKSSPVGTLLFDEIDSGIGGAVAEIVGKSLARLGRERQVLCVTHLPQVAAQGSEQWSVAKGSVRGRMLCTVRKLARAERVEELARMLGGTSITATTRRHAAEMLEGK